MKRSFALTIGLVALLLAACSPNGGTLPRTDTLSGSTVRDEDDTNERMPTGTDSLEAAAATGSHVPGFLTQHDLIVFGTEHAGPMLTEYFDYDCNYCRENEILNRPWLDRDFVSTGKLGIARIFAPQTAWGRRLAQSALCAADQNKFDAMDTLLIKQTPSNEVALQTMVKKAGVEKKSFDTCMKNVNRVPASVTLADGTKVDRVPMFTLGNHSWLGVLESGELRKMIEEAL